MIPMSYFTVLFCIDACMKHNLLLFMIQDIILASVLQLQVALFFLIFIHNTRAISNYNAFLD